MLVLTIEKLFPNVNIKTFTSCALCKYTSIPFSFYKQFFDKKKEIITITKPPFVISREYICNHIL